MNSNEPVSHIHSRQSTPDIPSPGSSAVRRSGPSYSRRRRRYDARFTFLKPIAMVAGVTALILLVLAKFSIEGLESENRLLAIKVRKQAAQLEESLADLQKLRREVATLVEARIPDLYRLELDRSIPLNQQYVRDVIFTLTGVGAEKQYEYRVVLHNDSLNTAYPLINVFIFDKLGIQLGSTKNARNDALPRTELAPLQPGEIRSYSSTVPLDRNQTPRYFLVTTD